MAAQAAAAYSRAHSEAEPPAREQLHHLAEHEDERGTAVSHATAGPPSRLSEHSELFSGWQRVAGAGLGMLRGLGVLGQQQREAPALGAAGGRRGERCERGGGARGRARGHARGAAAGWRRLPVPMEAAGLLAFCSALGGALSFGAAEPPARPPSQPHHRSHARLRHDAEPPMALTQTTTTTMTVGDMTVENTTTTHIVVKSAQGQQ